MSDGSGLVNDGDFKLLNARGDDEFVFDENGNLYLMDEVLLNILLSFKKVQAWE